VTEFKYLTGQESDKTTLVYEFPKDEGDPYYPVPRKENADLYRKYSALAEKTPDVHFCGRLATYKYYNMDQVVAQALTLFTKIAASHSDIVLPGKTAMSAPSRVSDPALLQTNGNGHSKSARSNGGARTENRKVPLRSSNGQYHEKSLS
jgi:UDP-galactopyranose mutase